MNYNFEWDPTKAKSNRNKHGVSFGQAATVFHDPNQLSVPDDEHSDLEDRWATMGIDSIGKLLVVVHTFHDATDGNVKIRIISARKATRQEIDYYTERKG